jgi:hypothetical protein
MTASPEGIRRRRFLQSNFRVGDHTYTIGRATLKESGVLGQAMPIPGRWDLAPIRLTARLLGRIDDLFPGANFHLESEGDL